MLRQATISDFEALCGLYQQVCNSLEANGLRQWQWGTYPHPELIRSDIEAGRLYCVYGRDGMAVAVTVSTEQEAAYGQANWLFGLRPGFFHRLAVQPQHRGEGLGRAAVEDVQRILLSLGCDSIRCDTGTDNGHAADFYRALGMRSAGEILVEGRAVPYIAFEKPLHEDCPLLPQRMSPAFRAGRLTPWGGDRLRTMYGKDIPEVPTGESLEVSCIPGLESRAPSGETLPEMIRAYGAGLVGKYDLRPFPLLLKLIDANDTLSVQVHPDDAFAAEHEGKLGKTEAWLILHAPEGAELVYGIRQGTDKAALREACEQGAAVEPLLRRVPVRAGDVCYIPAGCVHAIGKGIVLYEIQQSSDVTYRFYDWDRVDAKGQRRELHLEKALAVTNLKLQRDPVHAPDQPVARVLDEKYFTLDLLKACGELPLPPVGDFGLLTALDEGLCLAWESGELTLSKGESVLLPCMGPRCCLRGIGMAALSMPT